MGVARLGLPRRRGTAGATPPRGEAARPRVRGNGTAQWKQVPVERVGAASLGPHGHRPASRARPWGAGVSACQRQHRATECHPWCGVSGSPSVPSTDRNVFQPLKSSPLTFPLRVLGWAQGAEQPREFMSLQATLVAHAHDEHLVRVVACRNAMAALHSSLQAVRRVR